MYKFFILISSILCCSCSHINFKDIKKRKISTTNNSTQLHTNHSTTNYLPIYSYSKTFSNSNSMMLPSSALSPNYYNGQHFHYPHIIPQNFNSIDFSTNNEITAPTFMEQYCLLEKKVQKLEEIELKKMYESISNLEQEVTYLKKITNLW